MMQSHGDFLTRHHTTTTGKEATEKRCVPPLHVPGAFGWASSSFS
jgi:hypothetical protein